MGEMMGSALAAIFFVGPLALAALGVVLLVLRMFIWHGHGVWTTSFCDGAIAMAGSSGSFGGGIPKMIAGAVDYCHSSTLSTLDRYWVWHADISQALVLTVPLGFIIGSLILGVVVLVSR